MRVRLFSKTFSKYGPPFSVRFSSIFGSKITFQINQPKLTFKNKEKNGQMSVKDETKPNSKTCLKLKFDLEVLKCVMKTFLCV